MKPIIGVDLDDVLWDLLTAWLQRYNEVSNDNVEPKDIKSWNIAEYIHNGTKEMLFYILEQQDFWNTVEPRENSSKYLKKLMDDGYKVYIVTASNFRTIRHKLNRLLELFPFIDEKQIIVAYDKQLIDLDLLVDDNFKNLKDSNYKKLLFNTYHNQYINEKDIGATRVNNWEEIYDYIINELPINKYACRCN